MSNLGNDAYCVESEWGGWSCWHNAGSQEMLNKCNLQVWPSTVPFTFYRDLEVDRFQQTSQSIVFPSPNVHASNSSTDFKGQVAKCWAVLFMKQIHGTRALAASNHHKPWSRGITIYVEEMSTGGTTRISRDQESQGLQSPCCRLVPCQACEGVSNSLTSACQPSIITPATSGQSRIWQCTHLSLKKYSLL